MEIYNPDDQVARIKSWWKQYGRSLIAGVIIGVLLLAGLGYWKQYRQQQAEAASVRYQQLLGEYRQGQSETALAAAQQMVKDHASTPYAGKAALLAARLQFDAGDLAGARQQLDWAMNNASEPAVRHSARLRLGRLMLEQGETEAVLSLVQVRDMQGFDSGYEELRGDALLAKGDRDGARRAYRIALEKLPRGSAYARLMTLKLDNLGDEVKS